MNTPLLPYDEAASLIVNECKRPHGHDVVKLQDALGRVLCGDMISPVDMPLFDNSAMDGFAVMLSDRGRWSEVIGESAAGRPFLGEMKSGQAVRILTGAPLPAGSEAIVMVEEVKESDGRVHWDVELSAGENIRRRAEEFKQGATLLKGPKLLTPAVIGLAATVGLTQFNVCRKPKIGILTTGDELVEPGGELEYGQIYASNSYGIRAALESLGISEIEMRHVGDSPSETVKALSELLDSCDAVITCGGVSMGVHDYVKPAFETCGVEKVFWGVAVRPGQPFFFGRRGEVPVFGLPGNPVSALVTFTVLARLGVLAMMGLSAPPPKRAVLTQGISKKAGRLEFVRGSVVRDTLTPLGKQGSNMGSGLASANSLIHFPADATELRAGEVVDYTPLRWGIYEA